MGAAVLTGYSALIPKLGRQLVKPWPDAANADELLGHGNYLVAL
jgi:hypothetical protein